MNGWPLLLTQIVCMAPRAPSPLKSSLESKRLHQEPNGGDNTREWRIASEGEWARTGGRPAIGAFQPYEVTCQCTMNSIFLSYSSQDYFFAEMLAVKLAEHGFTIWRDLGSIRSGDDWRQSIEDGIKNCVAVVVALSESSADSA
jgi:TIR domain